jgi:hypothetical protein
VHSEELWVEDIHATFGSAACRNRRQGEPISRRNPGAGPRMHNSCVYESRISDQAPLALHLDSVASLAESHAAGLRALREGGADLSIRVMFGAESSPSTTSLEASLLARLGNLDLPVMLDFFPPGELTLGPYADFESAVVQVELHMRSRQMNERELAVWLGRAFDAAGIPGGLHSTGPARETIASAFCSFSSAGKDLDGQLGTLCQVLESRTGSLNQLRTVGFTLDVHWLVTSACGQMSTYVEGATLLRLSSFGLDCQIDM